jgi:hypothetical protein
VTDTPVSLNCQQLATEDMKICRLCKPFFYQSAENNTYCLPMDSSEKSLIPHLDYPQEKSLHESLDSYKKFANVVNTFYETHPDSSSTAGGVCSCPNGQVYNVGSYKNDQCYKLNCENGLNLSCKRQPDGWTTAKVICATPDEGNFVGGPAKGGYCKCASGKIYRIAAYNNSCDHLACMNGIEGKCYEENFEDVVGVGVNCSQRKRFEMSNSYFENFIQAIYQYHEKKVEGLKDGEADKVGPYYGPTDTTSGIVTEIDELSKKQYTLMMVENWKFPEELQTVVSHQNVIFNDPTDATLGTYSGNCLCPDGNDYLVSNIFDKNDPEGCTELACIGGQPTSCQT